MNPYEATDWRAWVDAVCALDKRFRVIEELAGPLSVTPRESGFAALVRVIAGQQLSTRAARAIYEKILAAQNPPTPVWVLSQSPEALRAFGLSGSKIKTCRLLADAVEEGRLDLDRLAMLSDEAVIETLTQFWGVGIWTAEIYLLFILQRQDVWPMGDLGLRTAYQRLGGLEALATPQQMLALGQSLRPYRSAAAHLMWHYLNVIPKQPESAKAKPRVKKMTPVKPENL